MSFTPTDINNDAPYIHSDGESQQWSPIYSHGASFPPSNFESVILNLIRNPNVNSSVVFRADVLYDSADNALRDGPDAVSSASDDRLRSMNFDGFALERSILREMIPRNPGLDVPLLQSCHFLKGYNGDSEQTLAVYIPHVDSASEMPYYHPPVRAVAFLHTWDINTEDCTISLHYLHFPVADNVPKHVRGTTANRTQRTALQLLSTIHKHGQNSMVGYVKRVHHDQIVPQKRLQDTYTRLKMKYAKSLVASWPEDTDPSKHVFEDLAIAAFLIELWSDLYQSDKHGDTASGSTFPGFVDIGCGNGLLVFLLISEGYTGWGMDLRARKSWATYPVDVQDKLKTAMLVPQPLLDLAADDNPLTELKSMVNIHNGVFPDKTFIIANHPDELTGWTPILALLSHSPFILIPCCSRNLSGDRFRAPPRKDYKPPPGGGLPSAYATLTDWAHDIAVSLGFRVQTEILRIPSTRNAAILGQYIGRGTADIAQILKREGHGAGWIANGLDLVKGKRKAH